MKKLIAVSALAAAFAAFAGNTVAAPALDFESITAGTTPVVPETGGSTFWNFVGSGDDGSLVQAYEGSEVAVPSISGPAWDGRADTNAKYLALSTEGGILWRGFGAWNGSGEGATATAQTVPETGLYVDTLVQFTPTEDGGTPELTQDDKLAIWLNVSTPESSAAPVTNLCVRAGFVDQASTVTCEPKTYTLVTSNPIEAGKWYRLTVKTIADCTKAYNGDSEYAAEAITGFQIYIDDTLLAATEAAFGDGYVDGATDEQWGWLEDGDPALAMMNAKTLFPSLQGQVEGASLTAVGFKGSGAIDDLVLTTENPFAVASVDFTLTWADGLTPVSYIIDDGVPVSLADATGTSFQIKGVPAGAPITFIYQNGDGVEKRTTGTIAKNGSLAADEAYTWDEYLGEAVEGAYTIDDESDLELFQKGVNNAKIPTAGVTFKLTADVALTEATDGIGARNMKDTLGSSLENYTAANVFKGTFDGDNHTISGVILKTGDYIGFFNSCYGATIKNLKLSLGNATGWSDATADQVGAVFVGVSVNTTLENCQTLVAGDNNTFKATKTAAGFVGYGANGTVFKDCVNNLNIWSVANEKAGGFVACGQAGKSTSSDGDGIEINGCSNLGDVQNGANAWVAGLVGYADLKVTLKGAITVAGTITAKSGAAKSLVGVNGGSVVVADGATLTVPAGYKTVPDGKAVDGLFFATVDGNVATLVKNSALAAGYTYKVMATGGAPTIELAEGETIAFDQTLATIDATGITAETGCEIEATGEGQPITYTAVKAGGWDPEADPTVTAASKGITGDLSSVSFKDLSTWAQGNGMTFEAGDMDAYKDAFLLNCAPSAVASEREAFKVTAITQEEDGSWTVNAVNENTNGKPYYGKVVIKGSETLEDPTWDATNTEGPFFKAFLEVKSAPVE